jgi:hypothetical protein
LPFKFNLHRYIEGEIVKLGADAEEVAGTLAFRERANKLL